MATRLTVAAALRHAVARARTDCHPDVFFVGFTTSMKQINHHQNRVEGLTVVDLGVTRGTGSGTVKNLYKLADFNGNYVAVSAGAALAGGGSVMTLRNQNGVVIDGVTTAQGVRLTVAPGGVSITLSSQS
jgi:hypothetical protein